MKKQLVLLEERPSDWRLDEPTRRAGRRGVQQAREALRRAAPTEDPPPERPAGKAA